MDLPHVVRELQQRVPWSIIRTFFREHSVTVGQGWDATLGKIFEKEVEKPGTTAQVTELLVDYFKMHLLCGEKAVSYYKFGENQHAHLLSKIQDYSPAKSPFSDSYPFPLAGQNLTDNPERIDLVKIESNANEFLLVFCSIRVYEATVDLEIDDLNPDAITEHNLSGFTQLVAKKKMKRQFYDVVSINKHTNSMQIRMDWGFGMSVSAFVKAIESLRRKVIQSLSEIIDQKIIIRGPLNLFPLINKLYENPNGSLVCELGFTTNSGSVKIEKMRRQPIDLRTEDYHQGGKDAVDGKISLYRIALIWKRTHVKGIVSSPELWLPGRLKSLSTPEPYLGNAILTNIYNQSDFDFIAAIVADCLPNEDE